MNEEKSTHYHRRKRRASLLSLGWHAALLTAWLLSGASVAVRERAQDATDSATLVVCACAIAVVLILEVGTLPITFYSGFVLERRYGLSNEPLRGWIGDWMKSFVLTLLLGTAAAVLVYVLARRSPGGWWLPAGLSFVVVIVGLATVAPLILLPLFYRVRPLAREALRARLVSLAERAGARVLGAYEWGLGDKTRKANAALTGLGSTRRILVSDTMLEEYSEDEIEVVLAHELAHHVHGDIWKGLLLEGATILISFYAAAGLLMRLAGPLALTGPADPAGLPLLLLAGGVVSTAMRPAAFALSRACERSADRFALTLTRNPSAFVSAMRRLSAQNLAEDQPSRLIQVLFYSHPPVRERIAVARAFQP